jgi:hypothetical protein
MMFTGGLQCLSPPPSLSGGAVNVTLFKFTPSLSLLSAPTPYQSKSVWVYSGIPAGGWHWVVLGTPLQLIMLLELTAGLVVMSIALTTDVRNWGMQVGPLGILMSPWLAG